MFAYKIFEKSIFSPDALFGGYVASGEGEVGAQIEKVADSEGVALCYNTEVFVRRDRQRWGGTRCSMNAVSLLRLLQFPSRQPAIESQNQRLLDLLATFREPSSNPEIASRQGVSFESFS